MAAEPPQEEGPPLSELESLQLKCNNVSEQYSNVSLRSQAFLNSQFVSHSGDVIIFLLRGHP